MHHFITVILTLGLLISPLLASEQCPPEGFEMEALMLLKENGFSLDPPEARNALAIQLLACTGHADPLIRDGIAFSGLSAWLRGKLLSVATVQELGATLQDKLNESADEDGFRRPFAALILSEVARSDRVEPIFSDTQRQGLVDSASRYLTSVDDYRGYSDIEGWRHGVAHGADLALQLILNPQITALQAEQLLNGVAKQVSPESTVFYVYGEPSRLARPVFYAYQRELFDRQWWVNWLNQVTDPAPLETWGQAWTSNAGLAKRHNTLAFLVALHFNAVNTDSDSARELVNMLLEVMKVL